MKKTYKSIGRHSAGRRSAFKSLLLACCVAIVSSCQLTELDINTDPNRPTTGSLSLLLPNSIKAAVNASDFSDAGWTGVLNGNDDYSLTNSAYIGTWDGFYNSTQNIEEMLKASADGKNPRYRGIALTLKAYSVGNFVDSFGDIPYSEAWQGNGSTSNFTPKFDKDSEIYEKLIKMCDEAVAELAKPQAIAVVNDFLYAGNAAKWTSLAKTVKLRLLFNSRKGRATGNADLAKAFADGGYITSAANDFFYQYSTVVSPQDNRHPWFNGTGWAGGGDFNYISHQLMGEMLLNKDPRLNYYFWRQTSSVLDPTNPDQRGTIPFGGTYLVTRPAFLNEYKKAFNITGDIPKADIAYIAGFFGRDRGDGTGVPADGALRLYPGAYPAGGKYQDKSMAAKTLTGGVTGGNGIFPLIMSWNVKFYQAEAILDGTGTTGDAKVLFEGAMREQIASVVKIARAADAAAPAASTAEVDAYVKAWLALYDAAPSNQAKLNVVSKQLFFCSFGQNVELWNMMRRTGYPVQGQFRAFSTGLATPLLKPVRQFALRLPYSSGEANLNPNAKDYVNNIIFDRDPIFWDKVKYKWEF
jgi:Starch-binding associating with outer membrane/Susd and RagB outer membrane lipoprotein